MKCPFCNLEESKVLDKRATENAVAVRRRRECPGCEKRYTTYERIEETQMIIVKKDGKKETFDRNKLLKGIRIACEKRGISDQRIEKIVDGLELKLKNYKQSEINSKILGNWVMAVLKKVDKVAYIRFASVYKEFTDIEELRKEVKKLITK
ncbi:transcriptional repressor NrdR [archaeon]|jgi:transcriptional repressor NrdR|nr:transcriptional repressor NrdR [archaeon]MBT4416603.1 transcriptional repressor NrdR [archaeon]